jgi:hypothetical protein
VLLTVAGVALKAEALVPLGLALLLLLEVLPVLEVLQVLVKEALVTPKALTLLEQELNRLSLKAEL